MTAMRSRRFVCGIASLVLVLVAGAPAAAEERVPASSPPPVSALGPSVSFATAKLEVSEGSSREAYAIVQLRDCATRTPEGLVELEVLGVDRTAVEGADFFAFGRLSLGTVAAAEGEARARTYRTRELPIFVVDDEVAEGEETFLLELRLAEGAQIDCGNGPLPVSTGPPLTVAIEDDDQEERGLPQTQRVTLERSFDEVRVRERAPETEVEAALVSAPRPSAAAPPAVTELASVDRADPRPALPSSDAAPAPAAAGPEASAASELARKGPETLPVLSEEADREPARPARTDEAGQLFERVGELVLRAPDPTDGGPANGSTTMPGSGQAGSGAAFTEREVEVRLTAGAYMKSVDVPVSRGATEGALDLRCALARNKLVAMQPKWLRWRAEDSTQKQCSSLVEVRRVPPGTHRFELLLLAVPSGRVVDRTQLILRRGR